MAIAHKEPEPVSVFPLQSEADYDHALAEIEDLWGAAADTPEGGRLDVLMDLVEVYEAKHHRIDLPDPIEAIQVRMADLNMDREAFGDLLGASSGRVSEILNRKRRLTLDMIRRLSPALGLSFECLCQDYSQQS